MVTVYNIFIYRHDIFLRGEDASESELMRTGTDTWKTNLLEDVHRDRIMKTMRNRTDCMTHRSVYAARGNFEFRTVGICLGVKACGLPFS